MMLILFFDYIFLFMPVIQTYNLWRDLGTADNLENIVLIQPQNVKIKVRPGSSVPLNFKIGQSIQYPLDLYFLLDFSWSMEKAKETVAEKGKIHYSLYISSISKKLFLCFKFIVLP